MSKETKKPSKSIAQTAARNKLGKRHNYENEPQKGFQATAIDLGFTAKEVKELARNYKGKINDKN